MFPAGHAHVRELGLAAGELLFQMQVEADEAEGQLDGLGLPIGVLHGEGVDYVLMDERRITMRQRVGAEFVEGVQFGDHGGLGFQYSPNPARSR